MQEKYLPIGTIVKINNLNKKVMIIGYYSIEYQDSVKIYDYVGCAYPEGMLFKNNTFSFNHSEIQIVLYMGYVDDEYQKFNNSLNEKLKENNKPLTQPALFEDTRFDEDFIIIQDEAVEDNNTIIENSNNDENGAIVEELSNNDSSITPEPLKENDDFHIPHYEFDPNGIVINN